MNVSLQCNILSQNVDFNIRYIFDMDILFSNVDFLIS